MQPDFQELETTYKFSRDVIELFWSKYGQRTIKILKALKRPCNKYAIRVNTLKITPKEVLDILHNMNIQANLHPIIEEIIYLPVSGPFPVPEYGKRVVADKFAAESLLQGADLFAPGVLKASNIRIGDKVTITDKTGEIVASGIAKMNAKDMLQLKQGLAIKITDSVYRNFSIRESQLFEEGYIFDQSFPSILVSRILNPAPTDSIIDICAAPGGKSTHLAQLMQNNGQIIAIDRSKPRLKRLKEHILRLGIENIKIIYGDSTHLPDKYHQWADKILIDPPCSALGVRPKLYVTTTKKEIGDLVNYQRQFLISALKCVKPGGILVYCTCTLTTEENENNIKFLIENFDCKIMEQPFFFGNPGEKIAYLEDFKKLQRFYPDTHDAPGYFIAKIKLLS